MDIYCVPIISLMEHIYNEPTFVVCVYLQDYRHNFVVNQTTYCL